MGVRGRKEVRILLIGDRSVCFKWIYFQLIILIYKKIANPIFQKFFNIILMCGQRPLRVVFK
jgi:hypothetical protein